MNTISAILTITAPIYLVILLGFLSIRWGLFSKADMRVFGKFVVNLSLPAMIFNALAAHPIGEIVNFSYLLAYLTGSLVAMGAGLWWCRKTKIHNPADAALIAMGMSCSNSGFVGFPIVFLVLPKVAGVALALTMVIENVFIIPILLTMAQRKSGDAVGGWVIPIRKMLLTLVRTPLIMGLLLGLLSALLQVELPSALARTVTLFASASGALSLFVIGGALANLPLRGMVAQVAPISFGKLLVHPLAVTAAFFALPIIGLTAVEPTLSNAAILLSAMPMMGIYPILAQAYGKESFASAALLLTTMGSFFTLNALLFFV